MVCADVQYHTCALKTCHASFTTGERPLKGDADFTSRMRSKSKTLEYEAFSYNPEV